MSLMDGLIRKIKYGKRDFEEAEVYQYCPRCDANLTLQKGYDPSLPNWTCLGCGETLVNPDADSCVVWYCDGCGDCLGSQPGFDEKCGTWTCVKCGFVNRIDDGELFASAEEYERYANAPFAGMTDDDLLELSLYEVCKVISDQKNVFLVRRRDDKACFVEKFLTTYDRGVLDFLLDHPVPHIPNIVSIHEGRNCLVEIEEFVEGETVESLLEKGPLPLREAVRITMGVCEALKGLHGLPRPIVHRDVKPSNVILRPDGEVVLLDVNVAKWHEPDKANDTRYLGTQNYAAPEQVGYGLASSSPKSDIYALGMFLNVIYTGFFPKEKKAEGEVWPIIERCINLNAEERFDVWELYEVLEGLMRK